MRTMLVGILVVLGMLTGVFSQGPNEARESFYPLEYQREIADAAARHQISPYLIAAVIKAESNWNPQAQSHVGAIGLMQVMPDTAQDMARWGKVDAAKFSPENLNDPATNIEYGTAYLRYLVDRYHEIEPVIAAYNAGPGRVDTWIKSGDDIRKAITFPETSAYLLKVVRNKEAYERIYAGVFLQADE